MLVVSTTLRRLASATCLTVAVSLTLTACGDLPAKDPNTTVPPSTNGAQGKDFGLQIPSGQGYPSRNNRFIVAAQWLTGPSTTVTSSCALTFADANRRVLSNFSLQSLIPWDYAAGQGASTQVTLSPSIHNPALISASNIVFAVTGQWILQVTATANGISDVAEIPVIVN